MAKLDTPPTSAERMEKAGQGAPEIAAEQGMIPDPVQSAPGLRDAGSRIVGAAKEGWEGAQFLTEKGQALADKYGLGGDARAVEFIMKAMNGAIRGGQQAVMEMGDAISPGLGRDLAGAVEAFPAGGHELGLHGAPGAAAHVVDRVGQTIEPAATPELRAAVGDMQTAAPKAAVTPPESAPAGALEQLAAEAKARIAAAPTPESGALNELDRTATGQPPPLPVPAEESIPTVTVRPQPSVPREAMPGVDLQPPPSEAPRRPVDAVTALIDAGGVTDPGGDFRAMDTDAARHRFNGQFLGRLVNNETGLKPDYAREFLVDRGYLPQDADINDLHDVVREHLAGNPTFTAEDQAEANQWRESQQAWGEYDRYAQARGVALETAADADVGLSPAETDHAAMLLMEGHDPVEAVRSAARASDDERGLYARRVPKPPAGGAPLLGEAAPDAVKREAEPTIRNDPRQVDMFGTADAAVQAQASRDQAGPKGNQLPADQGLFAPKETPQEGLFARREEGPAPVVDPEAHAKLQDAAQRIMRAAGLPPDVGLRLADRITDAAGNAADAHYTRSLISVALDTPAAQLPAKLWHEVTHALMDERLGLLNDAQRRVLLTAADRWLSRGENMSTLAKLGYDAAEMREEAVARMGEDALARGIKPPAPYQRMVNFTQRVGNWLRGEGYRTADDVFDSVMAGHAARGEADATGSDAFARRSTELTPEEQRKLGPLRTTAMRVMTAAADVTQSIADGLAPMQGGTKRAQSFAANFANALRQVQYRFGEIDKQIERGFTPKERDQMGRALDAQSVFEQQLRDRPPEEHAAARAEFDAAGAGLSSLTDKQRRVIDMLDVLSQDTWRQMQERGLVDPNARALPYYFPRQVLRWTEAEGFSRASGAGGRGRGLDDRGRNLTTAGPMRREHLTPEETEAAARAKLGQDVGILRDIRSLPSRLAFSQRAVAGADLISAIEKVGRDVGVDTVVHGDIPGLLNPADYFTMADHPSFRRWAGSGWQAIHVAKEFEGPLKAVLTKPSPGWYRAAQNVKGATMSAIMFSPFIHLAVELGRSLPVMPGRILTLRALRDGSTLRRDLGYMDQATRDGLAPLGQGWSSDPVSIADQANVESRNRFVRALQGARDAAANGARAIGGEFLHDVVQHPHQALLWDQVFNLQVGIYDAMRQKYVGQGYAPDVAGTMAAHIANRYAGALPPEHLSRAANMTANLMLFSRSFTLGNLGVMKDMLTGAPAHVLSRIDQMAGPEVAKSAQGALRRKAIAAFTMDIGLFYLANGLLQAGIQQLRGEPAVDDWLDKAKSAAASAKDNPLSIFGVLPQHWNEPGKQDRVYAGNDSQGRGIYLRLPAGKVGEEFLGWFGKPGTMIENKMSPLVRPIIESIFGKDTLGRDIYKPNPQSLGDYLGIAGAVVKHFAEGLGPTQFIQGMGEMYQQYVQGKPTQADPYVSAAKIIGPLTGLAQISQGFPGGPASGEMHAQGERERFDTQKAMPAIRDKIRSGDEKGAIEDMTALHLPAALQRYYLNQTKAPGMTRGAERRLQQAPPEIQERVGRQRGQTAP